MEFTSGCMKVKKEIVLKDEYKALYPVIGAGDEEDDGIFLKKHGGNIYLCGSSYAIADIYADGATISSFILTYEEGAFVQQAGTEEPISGSEFYWYSGYWDMAMMMDELDMTEDAAQVRRDHMPRFQSWVKRTRCWSELREKIKDIKNFCMKRPERLNILDMWKF